MSDRDAFVGFDKDHDGYCVFTLGDTHEISVGDRLLGDFHGHSASTFTAKNLTRKDSPRIDLLDWEMSLDLAVSRLIGLQSPSRFIVGSKVIMAHVDDVVRQLHDEILRS